MFTAIIPLVLALVGAAVYVLASNPKLQELGRLLFASGAFAFAFAMATKTFSL
jgi:chromate transport protein ChrA